MPAPLTLDDEAFALPAFRVMAWCDGSLNDPAIASGVLALLELFLAAAQGRAGWLMLAGHGHGGETREATPERLAAARRWVATPGHEFAATLRLAAWWPAPVELAGPPSFRVDERRGMVAIEIDLLHEAAEIPALADGAVPVLASMGLRAGVMGMGFVVPGTHDSLIGHLPRTTRRYPAALEIPLDGPVHGIRREGSTFDWDAHPAITPGLPDIGWRTMIGAPFAERLPDLSPLAAQGCTVRRAGPVTVIDAGPQPIWGDVNRDEDIAPYRAVAAALWPLRYPKKVAMATLFASTSRNPDRLDRLERYLTRLKD